MRNQAIESVKSAVNNWWMSLIIGILFTGMGIWMLCVPGATFAALVVMFSVFMFASGIFEIAFSLTNSKVLSGWGWYLVIGILDLVVGICLIYNPMITAVMIPFLIALWLMFRGFTVMGFALDIKNLGVKGWGWYLVIAILCIICSVLIIWQPEAGAGLAVYMASFSFLLIGFFRIMLSFQLKDLGNRAEELKKIIETK